MFDVNHNTIPEDATRNLPPVGAEDPLLQACKEFSRAFDMWRLLMKEGHHASPPWENMTYEDMRKIKQEWCLALARIRSQPAESRDGLEAKRRVLGALSHFGESDDPSYIEFAVELVDEYHRFFL